MTLLELAGMADRDDSLPLQGKSREELISLVIRLTEMTAQQARIIAFLREASPSQTTGAVPAEEDVTPR